MRTDWDLEDIEFIVEVRYDTMCQDLNWWEKKENKAIFIKIKRECLRERKYEVTVLIRYKIVPEGWVISYE